MPIILKNLENEHVFLGSYLSCFRLVQRNCSYIRMKRNINGILFFLFYYLFLNNIIIWLCPVDIKSKGRLVYIGSIKQIVFWQIVLLIVKLVCFKANFRSCSLILVDRVGFFALVDTIIQVICPSVRIPMYPTICQGNVSRSLSQLYVSSNRPVARPLSLDDILSYRLPLGVD